MYGAIPFLVCMVIFGIGWFMKHKLDVDVGALVEIIGAAVFLVGLFVLPIKRAEIQSKVKQYHVIKQTLKNSEGSTRETALAIKIVEVNAGLANLEYWNETIFDWYVPDEIETLEYLK